MKVDGGSTITSVVTNATPRKDTHQAPAAQGAPVADAFRVDISPAAEELSVTSDANDISHDKVAAIRERLAAGTYNISGKDVASKILKALQN